MKAMSRLTIKSLARSPARGAGFTVVELLVVIVVLGVLLSILVPALGEAREAAKKQRMALRQREVFRPLLEYVTDHHGLFPFYGEPGQPEALLEIHGQEIVSRWWSQPSFWGSFLTMQGYAGHLTMTPMDTALSEGEVASILADEERALSFLTTRSRDLLTWTAIAQPQFFFEDAAPDIRLVAPQRYSSVLFPSLKGLLIRAWERNVPTVPDRLVFVCFADGHVGSFEWLDLKPGVPVPPYLGGGTPVLSTPRGVLGVDR